MAKITSRSLIVVGTNLIIDETNRTFQLVVAGSLVGKDGVTIQALYSKFVDLWATSSYQDSPFPMNAIDALSGQYEIGVDAGGNYNGWAPKDVTTRNLMRDGGWSEYSAAGVLLRQYVGIVGLGSVSSGAQLYYQRTSSESPQNFVYTDQANQAVQVYGNAANGAIDYRSYFKAYCRVAGYVYTESTLSDTGKTATGAYIVNMLLSNSLDTKISAVDASMSSSPYSGITVTYYTTDQTRTIAGTACPFRVIIDGNGATLEQIYTKIQYLLRQNSDIDSGSGTVIGQTAAKLLSFLGDTLYTTTGVYIDNIQNADSNRIVFIDYNGTSRTNNYTASGSISFNSLLIGSGSSYRMLFTTGPSTGDDYGEAGALTVLDASGSEIAGTILSSPVSFTFNYDTDTIGGTAGTDKAVTIIAVKPGTGKFAVATGTLSKSKTMSFSVIAEQDRAYS
jgi:hypothetical protein